MTADLLALLDQLDEARAKATPGPWRLGTDDDPDEGQEVLCTDGSVADTGEPADAALIVAAVNALPTLTDALRAVLDEHTPIEWQECDEDGVPDLDKPLPPFCHGCTGDEYVNAVELGDTIDEGSPVVNWPCPTVQAITAALTPEATA